VNKTEFFLAVPDIFNYTGSYRNWEIGDYFKRVVERMLIYNLFFGGN